MELQTEREASEIPRNSIFLGATDRERSLRATKELYIPWRYRQREKPPSYQGTLYSLELQTEREASELPRNSIFLGATDKERSLRATKELYIPWSYRQREKPPSYQGTLYSLELQTKREASELPRNSIFLGATDRERSLRATKELYIPTRCDWAA